LQAGLLLGEVFDDDAPRRGMHARIGDLIEPGPELHVQVVEVAEAARREERCADQPLTVF
jgi:hypothetical protein